MLKVNKIYWRTLCAVYDDYNSTYEELLASQKQHFHSSETSKTFS